VIDYLYKFTTPLTVHCEIRVYRGRLKEEKKKIRKTCNQSEVYE
jgi:hypothetical protein